MTIERIPLTDVPREAWLERRREFINASETAIVVGEAQWGSLARLYAEKKGLRPPTIETSAMKRGRQLEGAVFDILTEERPEWEVNRAKAHVIDREKRQACTPDGFARSPNRDGIGVVQAKVVARNIFRHKWLEDPEDSIQFGEASPPPGYRIQTLHEMMLNECSWGVLAVLINGEYACDLRVFDVERNAVMEDRINYRIQDFFERYLDANVMPPFEPIQDELLVRELYPKDSGATVDLTGDNRAMALVEDFTQFQAAKKRADGEIKKIKTELEAKLGESTYGRLADGRFISWKTQHTRAHTVEAYDSRVFRIHKNQPKDADDETA